MDCGEFADFGLDYDWYGCPSVEGEWVVCRSMGVEDWRFPVDCVVWVPRCGRVLWRWFELVMDDEGWVYYSVVVVVLSRKIVGCEEWMSMSGWHGYVGVVGVGQVWCVVLEGQ